jgi:hypothetical protein
VNVCAYVWRNCSSPQWSVLCDREVESKGSERDKIIMYIRKWKNSELFSLQTAYFCYKHKDPMTINGTMYYFLSLTRSVREALLRGYFNGVKFIRETRHWSSQISRTNISL